MGRTPEGEVYLENVRKILGEIEDMEHQRVGLKQAPQGRLRVNTTQGFGLTHIAPLVSQFVRRHPRIDVQLQLSVNPPPLTDDAYDVCFRFGHRRIHAASPASSRNWRIVAASPGYLLRHLCALHRSNPSSTVSPHAVRTASETGTRDVSKRSRQAPR